MKLIILWSALLGGDTQVSILGDLGEVSTIVLDSAGCACSLVARDTRDKPLSYLVRVHWVVGRCDLHLLNLNPPWMWLVPNDNDYQSTNRLLSEGIQLLLADVMLWGQCATMSGPGQLCTLF
jgi:hypothetical protein